MARVSSPNPYIQGPSTYADVPSNGGSDLLQFFMQQAAQGPVYDPEAEAIQRAIEERNRIMAERGQSAPTIMPTGQTQGSLASVPHTGGYAGPTRASDLPFEMAQMPVLRSAPDQVRRAQPIPGTNLTAGRLEDLGPAMKGMPAVGQAGILEALAPGLVERGAEAATAGKLTQRERLDEADRKRKDILLQKRLDNASLYFNKKTGATLAADFVDSVPTNDIIERDYIAFKPKQLERKDGIDAFDNDLADLEKYMKRLPLPPKAGPIATPKHALNMAWRSLWNEETVREVNSLKQKLVLGINRAAGGTSKTADAAQEVEKLENALTKITDSREAAETIFDQLKRGRDKMAANLPLPGMHNKYAGKKTSLVQEAQQPQQQAAQPERVKMTDPNGNPVTVRADQLEAAIQRGYKQR
jgi:hypothetical protein